ncbi:hypothetical protein LQ953_04980 [Sphingomonas sp. IC-56]|uniref:hypothetical protein n=1 Tax=Sphingomonas sp. IC-56 TaxID=2898529 RepID=UPI001E564098|nr:hypothetical protein [Sphingomonas sp. IC-56]MCD2323367.1 hypothetical protein [Sphingomonas sp. IC-56]
MPARVPLALILVALALPAGGAAAQTRPTPPPSNTNYRPNDPGLGRQARTRPPITFLASTARPASARQQYAWSSQFADCVTSVSPSLSQRLLALDAESPEAAALLRQVRSANRACRPYAGTLPAFMLRGALAETLYRSAPAATPTTATGAGGAPLLQPATVESVSTCLYRQSPAAVDGLLRAELGSQEERAALSRLAGYAPGCIEAGRRVRFSSLAPFLRAELAQTAYRAVTQVPTS